MWEKMKNEPLIKTVIVILLGILAFGFAFNIMFGSGNTAMEDGSMMSSGYSLSNSLEYIIGLLTKLVIISFLIGIIVWIFRTITKHSDTTQADRFAWWKEDSIIRNTLLITGAVIVLLFGLSFLRSSSATRVGEEMSTGYSIMNTSFQATTLFAFLLKVLIFVFVILLGYAMLLFMKEDYKRTSGSKDGETLNTASKVCTVCKSKIKDEWKACPYCGSDTASDNGLKNEE